MSIQIRKATREDLDAISEIYDQIHASTERGETYTGWLRGVYPVRATAEAALERGDLFIEEADGSPLARRSSIGFRWTFTEMPNGNIPRRTIRSWCCTRW